MQARELISLIRNDIGTAFTRQRIMEVINRVQNNVLTETTQIMRITPDPFLTTVDGTYSYIASDTLFDSTDGTKGTTQWDIRTVKDLYSFSSSDTSSIDGGSYRPNQIRTKPNADETESTINVVVSKKADNSDCLIKFWEGNNPGATTISWRAVAYRWPTQVTAESTELEIPDDFCDTLLYWGVIKRVQRAEYGRNATPADMYDMYLKEFRNKYNRAKTQEPQVCYPRDM